MNPKPYAENYIESDNHKIYYAEYGNSKGPAIISFHGGPGSASKPYHAARFDLSKYRVVLFDQRGCGKSTWESDMLENNTTQYLISDAELIREALDIDTWFVSGGSWGSTMAVIYAEAHPEKTRGLLVASIWLARERDHDWERTEGGVARLMPDLWEKRLEFLDTQGTTPKTWAEDLLPKLVSPDVSLDDKKRIAAGIADWERNLFWPHGGVAYMDPEDISDGDIHGATIFAHYDAHSFFMMDNQILDNVSAIQGIPAIIISGRYDILTPLEQAYALHKALPKSRLVIADTSGHKMNPEASTLINESYARFLENHV